MNQILRALPFDGINTDSLGNYLAGLGLLAATAQQWPNIRACWHDGRFTLLSDQVANVEEIKNYLLTEWNPTPYERWWYKAQLTKSPANLWKVRNERHANDVRQLDAHIVPIDRNCFNPILGHGGSVGRRNLSKVWKDAIKLLAKPKKADWLKASLFGATECELPPLGSSGTWFVFANKTFNSGQNWYREGQLSPWSFLLSMEGAFLLVGGVNRRLGSRSRPYAVFPFVSDPSPPETDGEIGLVRAEFWAPLWEKPATLGEVAILLRRGLAKLGERAARAPHEFAVAALSAGVDAGVTEFARFELRQTTSSQVYEAIPREHIAIKAKDKESASIRSKASNLLLKFIDGGWLNHLPYEPSDSKQKGKFVGLRGPIETAIVGIGERPDDPLRWRTLLLKLAAAQARIDRNKNLREQCAALRPLDPMWFDLAWPSNDITPEIEMAGAIASVGWCWDDPGNFVEKPLLANIFGVEITGKKENIRVQFPKARTAQAVWGTGSPSQLLLEVAHRRLIDASKSDSRPFAAACFCAADAVHRLLRDDGSLDLAEVIHWVPALSLIDWSQRSPAVAPRDSSADAFANADGTVLLQALARPLYHGRPLIVWNKETGANEPLFPQELEPTPGLMRRIFNLLRFNALDEAIQVLHNRYLAAGRDIVVPPFGFEANGELVAASLLIPVSDQVVVNGLRRWLQPTKRHSN